MGTTWSAVSPTGIHDFQDFGDLRAALKTCDRIAADEAASKLRGSEIMRYLDSFLAGGRERPRQPGKNGFIYVLSTRSQPRLLKISFTQRNVEVRVKEINSATGVIVPYGVRGVWQVDDAAEVKQALHTLFAPSRIRADREFFELDFFEASRLINDYLGGRRRLKKREREEKSVVGPHTP